MKIRPDWYFIFHLFYLSTPLLIPASSGAKKRRFCRNENNPRERGCQYCFRNKTLQ